MHASARDEPPGEVETIRASVAAGAVVLHGDLGVPAQPRGVVAFAHGSGSSRHSPRNRMVARGLWSSGLATLLIDLLSEEEDREDRRTCRLRFDVQALAERVASAADWLAGEPATRSLPVGLFGASTGAAAALLAQASRPERVRAVVSRGGRPDLAGDGLPRVTAPTLLIVGGRDESVLALNRDAMRSMACARRLEVVAGASHLFEEPGALERVVELSAGWFSGHLGARAPGDHT